MRSSKLFTAIMLVITQAMLVTSSGELKKVKYEDNVAVEEYITIEKQPEIGKVQIIYYPAIDEIRIIYKVSLKMRSSKRAVVILRDYSDWVTRKLGMFHYKLIDNDIEHFNSDGTVTYLRHLKLSE